MSVKELVIDKLNELPEDVSAEEIQDRVAFVLGIRRAMYSLDEGKGISKDEARSMVSRWAGR